MKELYPPLRQAMIQFIYKSLQSENLKEKIDSANAVNTAVDLGIKIDNIEEEEGTDKKDTSIFNPKFQMSNNNA